ncbi:hypothetical protein [Streptomyces sp. NPDC091217]
MTGDVSHTRWGRDNGAASGTSVQEREPGIKSLLARRRSASVTRA